MKASEEIVKIELGEEFRVCPKCSYELGFHSSFLRVRAEEGYRIILICPECGARYDVGWKK
jgi:RNase P subunit RPR2